MSIELSRGRMAWICAAGIAAMAWMLPNVKAQFGGGGIGGGGGGLMKANSQGAGGGLEDANEEVPRIYFKAPMSAEAAATWIKLGKKAPMPFANETPLDEFLKTIKKITADKDDPDGAMIYVDPVGLSEAEKTLSSPVTLDLANIKVETALKLVLKQLDLCFQVTPDGLIIITSVQSRDAEMNDPDAMILDQLEALRGEVRQLRGMIAGKK